MRGESADGRIGAGESPVFEHGMIKEIGRGHGGLDAPVAKGFFQILEDLVALRGRRPERNDVVVVEFEAVAIPLRQAADAIQRTQLWAGLVPERIAPAVLQAPNAEGEFVFFGGSKGGGWHGASPVRGWLV